MSTNQKPPVLLIHGMWSDADTMSEVRDAFSEQGYPVEALTLPHHAPRASHSAESRRALAQTRLQDYVRFLVNHASKLDRAPILVGHSMGGLLAQLTAARIPCERVILLSSAAPAGINGLGLSVFRTLGRNLLRFPLWRQATELGLANVQYGIANAQSEAKQRDIFEHCGYESGMVTFQMTLAAFTRKAFANVEPDSISCPILIVGGTADRITPIRIQRQIAQRYGDRCKLVELPGCDHWTIGGRFFGDVQGAMFQWLEQADYSSSTAA
ncbi:alpha/beta hydrolase fold protein [Marinobacter santoriniensis NKSG1]|uniref:Alpha/beta hydrolase fold protein n=1 Tax=Marinobacter santoriniensis NKSG1 TaxID=1288826 RepID=M7DF07_9GAMM|nr:alpha/beta hydrolase [Marinobacter santoriniensis]EMP56257.1 alpha/beta hydrolase fold protein [Marinobacter santoriniensis NKSG1]